MKKTIILIVLIIFSFDLAYSQEESELLKRLNKPLLNCETISFNCQDIISGYDISQRDSIDIVLSYWKEYCKISEPILRIEILLSIKDGLFNDSLANNYSEYISKYKERIRASKSKYYDEIYENHKVYFDYCPLNGKFDKWTKQMAQQLIKTHPPKTSEYLICLVLTDSINTFDNSLNSSEYKENPLKKEMDSSGYISWNNRLTFNLISGIWYPLGDLSNTFIPSFQLGISFGYLFTNSIRIDIGATFAILRERESKRIDVHVGNDIKSVKSTVCGTIGGIFTKEFQLNSSLFFDLVGGIGMGFIDTDLQKPRKSDATNDTYYAIQTIDFSLGISLKTICFDTNTMGIHFNYHFTPFQLDNILVSNLGNQFISLSMIYNFNLF